MMVLLEENIIATDLAVFLRNSAKLAKILECDNFDQEEEMHKYLLRSIMMTCCDLSASCKPFKISKTICHNLMKEFYHQV